eukprot:5765138-Amphidinium_carterae.1
MCSSASADSTLCFYGTWLEASNDTTPRHSLDSDSERREAEPRLDHLLDPAPQSALPQTRPLRKACSMAPWDPWLPV